MTLHPQEVAYWLFLAFDAERGTRREVNGLVLTAHRREGLGLLDLVRLDPARLPESLRPHAHTLERLQAAEGRIAGQAFAAAELERRRIHLVPITHPRYPAHLAIRLTPAAAPTVLLVAGDLEHLSAPGVAVSGSRAASPRSLAFARAVAAELAGQGSPVVSGLARGVDSEALEGALAAGGTVIGIAAEGLLASRWARDSRLRTHRFTVISEFALKQAWQAGAAMARNRTIAGMSRALIVADCVADGGTTHQVDVHLKLGLPVFVRRGVEEGAKIAALAELQGVRSLHWDAGPITLPDALSFACPVQQEALPSADTASAPAQAVADGPRVDPVAKDLPESARILAALDHADRPLSLEELATTTALTEARLRRCLLELIAADSVVRFKQGRRYQYSRRREDPRGALGPLFATA